MSFNSSCGRKQVAPLEDDQRMCAGGCFSVLSHILRGWTQPCVRLWNIPTCWKDPKCPTTQAVEHRVTSNDPRVGPACPTTQAAELTPVVLQCPTTQAAELTPVVLQCPTTQAVEQSRWTPCLLSTCSSDTLSFGLHHVLQLKLRNKSIRFRTWTVYQISLRHVLQLKLRNRIPTTQVASRLTLPLVSALRLWNIPTCWEDPKCPTTQAVEQVGRLQWSRQLKLDQHVLQLKLWTISLNSLSFNSSRGASPLVAPFAPPVENMPEPPALDSNSSCRKVKLPPHPTSLVCSNSSCETIQKKVINWSQQKI
jgi:hypothetical protein